MHICSYLFCLFWFVPLFDFGTKRPGSHSVAAKRQIDLYQLFYGSQIIYASVFAVKMGQANLRGNCQEKGSSEQPSGTSF